MAIKVNCKRCKKEFLTVPSALKRGKGKVCSTECQYFLAKGNQFAKGNPPNKTSFKKGIVPWNKDTEGFMPHGEESYQWKGDAVGYIGLHNWVRKMLGKPDVCEHCGKSGLLGHSIHWANLSGEYKRKITDWIRLCVRCHAKYDKERRILDKLSTIV